MGHKLLYTPYCIIEIIGKYKGASRSILKRLQHELHIKYNQK